MKRVCPKCSTLRSAKPPKDLAQQLDGVANVAIQLVDEADDGRIAQTADIHQLDGALLHTLGAVDHHQCTVHRRQGAVGILGKVLVPGGVQQIYRARPIRKLHHRGRDRDTALLLHAHPVGRGVRPLLALYAAGDLDGAAQQQQFFGDGGLARIRVGDDGKSPALVDFIG